MAFRGHWPHGQLVATINKRKFNRSKLVISTFMVMFGLIVLPGFLLDLILPNNDEKSFKNIVGNGENAGNFVGKGEKASSQHFLLFPQCFLPNEIQI